MNEILKTQKLLTIQSSQETGVSEIQFFILFLSPFFILIYLLSAKKKQAKNQLKIHLYIKI